jgi:hypothetical protein
MGRMHAIHQAAACSSSTTPTPPTAPVRMRPREIWARGAQCSFQPLFERCSRTTKALENPKTLNHISY